MGGKASKTKKMFGFNRKNSSNKGVLDNQINCPGCNTIYGKNTSI